MSANNIIEEEETSAIIANHLVAHAENLDNEDQAEVRTLTYDATCENFPSLLREVSGTEFDNDRNNSNEYGNAELDDSNPLKFEYQVMPWRHRPSHIMLRVAIVIQIIGTMSAVTSQLDAIVYLVCQNHYNQLEPLPQIPSNILTAGNGTAHGHQSFQDPRCFAPEISALVSIFQTYMTTITAILGVVTVPILASLSDRLGRKRIFIWAMSCNILSLMITIICCTFPVNYRFFLVASVIDGIGGSMYVMVILCCSYTSDCVREQFRAGALSVLDAFVYGGIALGPFFGSLVLKASGRNLLTLFSFSLACQVLSLAIMIFFVNESRSEKERHKSQGEHLNRKNSFLDERRRRRFSAHSASYASIEEAFAAEQEFEHELTFNWSREYFIEKAREILHNVDIFGPLRALAFTHLTDRRARINAFMLAVISATSSEVIIAAMPLVFLYAKTRFGWTSVENGYFISLLGSSRFVVLSALLPVIINFCRRHWQHRSDGLDRLDIRLLQGGFLFSIAGHLLMAEAQTGTIFTSAVFVISFGSGNASLLRNALMKHAPKDRIGEILGAASLISRLQNTVIPALFATVYSLTVARRPQAIIEMLGAVEALMFVLISGLYLQGSVTLDGIDEFMNQQA